MKTIKLKTAQHHKCEPKQGIIAAQLRDFSKCLMIPTPHRAYRIYMGYADYANNANHVKQAEGSSQ